MKAELYSDVLEALRFPGSLCLTHLGALRRTEDWLNDISSELESRGFTAVLADPDPESIARATADDAVGEVLILNDLRTMLSRRDCAELLQQMRPPLIHARAAGWRVLLVSTVPPDLYPPLAGSSILIDAHLVQGRPLPEGMASNYVQYIGVNDSTSIANIVQNSCGSRALLEQFAAIDLADHTGNVKRQLAEKVERALALRAFDEVGPSLCTWLEYWSFECGREKIDESDIANHYIVALRSAGLITPSSADSFAIFPMKQRQLWQESLGQYLESVVVPPPSWGSLATELFEFERKLRWDIKKELLRIQRFDLVLDKYGGKILDTARRDSIPGAASISDIRSPLDWLTLADLLDVAQEHAPSSSTSLLSGYSAIEWSELARVIVPIRNRVAHMRLPRQGDREALRKCRRHYELTAERRGHIAL